MGDWSITLELPICTADLNRQQPRKATAALPGWLHVDSNKRLDPLLQLVHLALSLGLLLPILTVLSRNASFPLLVSMFLLLGSWGVRETLGKSKSEWSGWKPAGLWSNMDHSNALVCLFVFYAALSLWWSPDRGHGLGALIQTTVVSLLVAGSFVIVHQAKPSTQWIGWALPLGLLAASVLIVLELRFGSPVRQAFGGSTEPFRLNRAAIAVVVMTPLLFLTAGSFRDFGLSISVMIVAGYAAFTSISESAKVAFCVVAVVFLLSLIVRTRLLLYLCGSGLILSHTFAPFIAWTLYSFVPQSFFTWIGFPTQSARLHIWWAFARQIDEALLFGHGLQASRKAAEAYPYVLSATIERSNGSTIVIHPLGQIHPHNFSIQVWYELGLVGVALTTLIMLLLLRQLAKLGDKAMIVTSALMASIWSVTYLSHGAWQHWWWAMVGVVAMVSAAVIKSSRSERGRQTTRRPHEW